MIDDLGQRIARVLPVLLVALLVCACDRGGGDFPGVKLELEVSPEPPQLGPATITVILEDASGLPLAGADIEVEANMSHAGMVPVIGAGLETAPGIYQTRLEFTMGGDWFIVVRARLEDGRSAEWVVDLPGVDAVCGDTPQP
ncbi:FixH family protein [Chloroflexota bacterium]